MLMSPEQQMVIAILSSSAVTGAIIESIRIFAKFIGKKRDTGLAKLEREVSEINQTVKELKKDTDELENINNVLLHNGIWSMYQKFGKSDFISIEDRANLDYMMERYTGNHRAAIMYEQLSKKPVLNSAGN